MNYTESKNGLYNLEFTFSTPLIEPGAVTMDTTALIMGTRGQVTSDFDAARWIHLMHQAGIQWVDSEEPVSPPMESCRMDFINFGDPEVNL